MLDLRKLRMLATLERLGTVAAAAAELHLTAPGISMQLAALEREVGLPLTERQGRRLALTAAGKVLAAHGNDVLERLSLVESEVDALRRGAVGSYRIAAFPSAARTFVARAWQTILDETGLELSVTTPEPEEALATLIAGATDLAVVHSYSNVPRVVPEGVAATPIAVEPVWVAIRADDPAAGSRVDLSRLSRHRWIAPTRPYTCHEMTRRACGLAGFEPNVVAESMDFTVQLELVAAGVGVALVPHLTIVSVPPGVTLARPEQPVVREISACIRSAATVDRGLRRVLDHVQREARKLLDVPEYAMRVRRGPGASAPEPRPA
jgi:DNA-binding transcriptional LysR family regulator